ncbi:MAG: hypothetical protein M3N53_06120 [Actinomycetota bacterium]|nr:hypothetical protein [Actinomycetota bacterium]
MGKWTDRTAEWDDKTLIYNPHDPKHRFDWRRYSIIRGVAALAVVGLIGLLDVFLERGVAIAILLTLIVTFLVFYVPWRRKRNEGLTGSPTKWPTR